MKYVVENEILKISIQSKGAELDSIYHKHEQLEYLWNGDPNFWSKKSPVLFPIVGTLKHDTFFHNGNSFQLSRHGFARDQEFVVSDQTNDSITFSLDSNEESLKRFPFVFRFDIIYAIQENRLSVTYSVKNKGKDEMYFSVGGHPAFKLPLADNTDYNDYYLEFNEVENAGRWPITANGLIENFSIPVLNNSKRLLLTKDLFSKDALVFKHLKSTSVKLKSDKTNHGLTFDFPGFPFLGIWAAKNADFVCIEPWCGIADGVETNQQLQHKEGIEQLASGEIFKKTWQVSVY